MGGEPEGLLGANLRRAREARRLTQEALGARAGVSRNYIASLEVGRIKNPGVMPCYALAQALGVTLESLLGRRTLAVAPVRPGPLYTLTDAQRELEARLVLVNAEPFDLMTPEQADAYLPASVERDELLDAGNYAVSTHLARSRTVPDEWAALSWYTAGACAMAVRLENADVISPS